MPQWKLNAHQRELLASCIEIGLEGASENHVDGGGDNSEDDLQIIARIVEELQESNAVETIVDIAPTRIELPAVEEGKIYAGKIEAH